MASTAGLRIGLQSLKPLINDIVFQHVHQIRTTADGFTNESERRQFHFIGDTMESAMATASKACENHRIICEMRNHQDANSHMGQMLQQLMRNNQDMLRVQVKTLDTSINQYRQQTQQYASVSARPIEAPEQRNKMICGPKDSKRKPMIRAECERKTDRNITFRASRDADGNMSASLSRSSSSTGNVGLHLDPQQLMTNMVGAIQSMYQKASTALPSLPTSSEESKKANFKSLKQNWVKAAIVTCHFATAVRMMTAKGKTDVQESPEKVK